VTFFPKKIHEKYHYLIKKKRSKYRFFWFVMDQGDYNEEDLINKGFNIYNSSKDVIKLTETINEIKIIIDTENTIHFFHYKGVKREKLTTRHEKDGQTIYICSIKKIIAFFLYTREYPQLKPYDNHLDIQINFNSDKDLNEKLPKFIVKIKESHKLSFIMMYEYDLKLKNQQEQIDILTKRLFILENELKRKSLYDGHSNKKRKLQKTK
jgi:hypothetical protein